MPKEQGHACCGQNMGDDIRSRAGCLGGAVPALGKSERPSELPK
jgi:hypothetical protein